MKILFLIVSQLIHFSLVAQVNPVIGEYIFARQEMVAAFNFSSDGRFEFFHSYGAVDRNATGKFTVNGRKLIVYSGKAAGKDFTILQQTKQTTGYQLQFVDSNKYLLSNIRCIFKIGTEVREAVTDEYGRIKLNYSDCDSIYVQHLLFPDIVTLVKDINNTNNLSFS